MIILGKLILSAIPIGLLAFFSYRAKKSLSEQWFYHHKILTLGIMICLVNIYLVFKFL